MVFNDMSEFVETTYVVSVDEIVVCMLVILTGTCFVVPVDLEFSFTC
jgi:hypothetical protein